MKLNTSKENVSFSMESWLIDIMDNTCTSLDINRSQLIARAVKKNCLKKVVRNHPELLATVYTRIIEGSNGEK